MSITPCETYYTDHAIVRIPGINLQVSNQLFKISQGTGASFKQLWRCGTNLYMFLPSSWNGCCALLNHNIVNLKVLAVKPSNSHYHRVRREMAAFNDLESCHWRISLGEKWGIGIFPWYGVTFLADHIDNITHSMSQFTNETINGFKLMSSTQKSHRVTLLKHEMVLDYLLAKTGGLCATLNFTGDACVSLIPNNSDNITSVIHALETIHCWNIQQDTPLISGCLTN